MTPLNGKRAIVTGASRGIGLAIARSLAEGGARVALLARNADRLEQAADQIGHGALAVVADVSDPGSVAAAFETVGTKMGGLDILVNNAGVSGLYLIEEAKDDEVARHVATNFLSVVYCARAAIPMLRAAGGGDILNVSSSAVDNPYPYMALYAATKAAVEQLSVALRREVRSDGIRVSVFRAGPTWTNFNRDWDPQTAARAFAAWTEGGFPGWSGSLEPRVVGEAVASALCAPAQASMEFFELHPTVNAPPEPETRE
ncbi:MAG: SDR family oxidoreductase [Deltaproteobacteria bacterium]